MRYGIPYSGSKSRIAKWVVDVLPASTVLVDLFAGGCAVTHCAMLSGKWERVYANDISDSVRVFKDAVNGEFDDMSCVLGRDEFNAIKNDDFALALLYSFGNCRSSYLWSQELEPVKNAAEKMLAAPSMHERRMYYKQFIHALADYLRDGDAVKKLTGSADGKDKSHGLQGLQGLEGLERLQGLERLERLQGLYVSQLDYRDVAIPNGATVYADPPYRGTECKQYVGEFDFGAFDEWLASVDFPVFVSEFTPPLAAWRSQARSAQLRRRRTATA